MSLHLPSLPRPPAATATATVRSGGEVGPAAVPHGLAKAFSPPLQSRATAAPPPSALSLGRYSPPANSPPGARPPPVLRHSHHHEEHLRKEAVDRALGLERDRVTPLEAVESKYAAPDELRAALKRERRHSARLAAELASHRWDAVSVQAAAEVTEEARVNALVRQMNQMREERCRLLVDLEREEERIANRLMERLEGVRREKRLLERQIQEGGGGIIENGILGGVGDGRFGTNLIAPSGRTGVVPLPAAPQPPEFPPIVTPSVVAQNEKTTGVNSSTSDQSAPFHIVVATDAKISDRAIQGGRGVGDLHDDLVEGEEDEEEVSDDDEEEDDDNFCGNHDLDMEEDLRDLLKKKNLR